MGFCVPFTARVRCDDTCAKARWFAIAILACLAMFCETTLLHAQSPSFTDFSSIPDPNLVLNGSSAKVGNVLRLTPATPGQAGSAWFSVLQPVASGFSTTFKFQITPPTPNPENPPSPFPADGFAFVIQDSTAGTAALGQAGGAIGYGGAIPVNSEALGIDNSLAIEFDTFANPWDVIEGIDPANHVAIQTCGPNANSVDHAATYTTGIETILPCNLAIANAPVALADGNPHTVKIEYTPATGCDVTCSSPATIQVTIDDLPVFGEVPAQVPDLTSLLNLAATGGEGSFPDSAYTGFTGATGDLVQNNDILSWTLTPHGSEAITKTNLPANVFTTFNFGSYLYKVKPDQNIESLTVTEVPTDFETFNAGTNFPTAECIIYDHTGGKCIEFHAACTGGTCTNVNYEVVTSYDVPSGPPITNPGFLKATGLDCLPGITFDQNIITAFSQTRTDPTTKGSSRPTFSCFVAVQNLTYGPADLDIVNLASPKVKPNSNLTYLATATNFGPNGAQGVALTNTIPSGTQYVSSALCTLSGGCSPTPCTFDGTAVSCSVGNMDKFALRFMKVTVKVTAPVGNIIRDTASITAFNPDPDRSPDRSWTAVTVVSNR